MQWMEPRTSHGPSATLYGDRLLLTWKGARDRRIYVSFFDGDEFTGQINIPNVGTSEGACVHTSSNVTYMAWKGVEDDNRIYWFTF